MCMDVCRPKSGRLPPGNGISTWNSLISSPDLDSPQKFILDWYLFLNGCCSGIKWDKEMEWFPKPLIMMLSTHHTRIVRQHLQSRCCYRCLQITLIQIYFWYYKTIWGHFNNGCLFLLQTTEPIRMQGQQKILPPAGEEGHSSSENAW